MAAHAIADDPGKPDRPDTIPAFDAEKMRPRFRDGILEPLFRSPLCLIRAVRWFGWLLRPFNIHFVIRYDQVREAFGHDRHFPVGWGHRMRRDTAQKDGHHGHNFVLGMKRDSEYRKRYEELAKFFPLKDVPARVASPAKNLAEERLRKVDAGKKFDAVELLIHGVPTALCRDYFGVRVDDEKVFAKWTLAASAYTFGTSDKKETKDLGLGAAACLRVAIMDAIKSPRKETVIQAMIDNGVDEHQIRAQLFGMVLGFVPTDVLAGGNILETLLRKREFLERARAAALADDDELLWRCLREALRFRNINPFMWRKCPGGHTFADGRRIPPGARNRVLISNQAAMWDPKRVERPHIFDPYRRDEDYLVFNPGQHWCLGAYIAKAQLTQTFKPLLKRPELRAAGKMVRFSGIFPMSLHVTFGKGQT